MRLICVLFTVTIVHAAVHAAEFSIVDNFQPTEERVERKSFSKKCEEIENWRHLTKE